MTYKTSVRQVWKDGRHRPGRAGMPTLTGDITNPLQPQRPRLACQFAGERLQGLNCVASMGLPRLRATLRSALMCGDMRRCIDQKLDWSSH